MPSTCPCAGASRTWNIRGAFGQTSSDVATSERRVEQGHMRVARDKFRWAKREEPSCESSSQEGSLQKFQAGKHRPLGARSVGGKLACCGHQACLLVNLGLQLF